MNEHHIREAHRLVGELRHRPALINQAADDIAGASAMLQVLLADAFNQREYIGHLERRLAERLLPPLTVLEALAGMERDGAKLVGLQLAPPTGQILMVRVQWPGSDDVHEYHMMDNAAQLASDLQEAAARRKETTDATAR